MSDETTDALTQRERELLDLLAQGLTTKAAAVHLGIAESTAKSHLKRVHRKLGVTNRVQALSRYSERISAQDTSDDAAGSGP